MPRCIILTPLYAGEELPWIAPQPGRMAAGRARGSSG